MKNRLHIVSAMVIGSLSLVALGYGVAVAQTPAPGAAPADAPPITGGVTGTVNLTPAEISKQAETGLARMEMNMMAVQRMIDKADQEGNTVKLDCLNDKLTIIDTRLRASRDRKTSLDGSLRTNDSAQASTHLQVIQSHVVESNKAKTNAELCVGSEIGLVGDTKTTTTVDPNIPDDTGGVPPPVIVPGGDLPGLPPSDATPDS